MVREIEGSKEGKGRRAEGGWGNDSTKERERGEGGGRAFAENRGAMKRARHLSRVPKLGFI